MTGASRSRRTRSGARPLRGVIGFRGVIALGGALVLLGACSSDDSATPAAEVSTTASDTTAPTTTAPTTAPTTNVDADTAACGTPGTPVEGEGRMQVAGEERSYLVALPQDLDPARPTPVVLNFHGSGSDMSQQVAYSRLAELGTARGYVVVTPQGTGQPRGWDLAGGKDDVFVAALLDELDTQLCVDRDAVFASGISNGSAYSALLACRAPYRLAAVALVAATSPNLCPDTEQPAVLAVHGTADPVVAYEGGEIRSEGADGMSSPGVEPAIETWATHNGCDPEPREEPLDENVVVRRFTDCEGGEVSFYRVEGGGHTWPGPIDVASLGLDHLGATTSTVDASELALDLFDRTRGS